MKFKREKIKRSQLDELSRTMSVIPMSELMLMMGEYGPGYYELSNCSEMDDWLSSHVQDPNYKEAVFYWFDDGSVGMLILPTNTPKDCDVLCTFNSSGQAMFSGKTFSSYGHTHLTTSDISTSDYSAKDAIGLPTCIYFSGIYHWF